jgi:hypothetical protein
MPVESAWTWPLIGTLAVGIGGLALSVWNTIDRIRDRRKAAKASLPKAELEQCGSGGDWCQYRALFSSVDEARFDVVSIEAKGWTFTRSMPSTAPPYDPDPETPDKAAATKILALEVPISIDRGSNAAIYTNLYFWARPDTPGQEWKTTSVYLNCRWRWGQRSTFRLRAAI